MQGRPHGDELPVDGLRSFATIAHKPLRRWLVFTGERPQRFDDGTEAIPYRELLLERLPSL